MIHRILRAGEDTVHPSVFSHFTKSSAVVISIDSLLMVSLPSVVAACAIQTSRWLLFLLQADRRALKISHRQLRVLTMTLQTPAHGQRRKLSHSFHGLNRPMAALAGHSGNHVLAVIEVHKVRQVMHLDPADRPILLHSLFHLFNFDGLLFQNRVAIHADACRRNTCVTARTRRVMAIETRDFVVSRMHFMRKGYRLLRG